ncbi:MAG: hypothetical protein LBU85_11010, partial [Treponema sp.]|nr:hypothetical protein [Treponema sp.]
MKTINFPAAKILFVFLFLHSFIFASADEKSDLELLQRAYPGAFEIVPNGIRFPSGKIIVYNDGEKKDFAALLERPDLRDMISLEYPAGEQKTPPSVNFDPGRFRNDDFFRALYGKDEKEI